MAKVELIPPFKKIKGTIGNPSTGSGQRLSYRWMHGQQTVMKTPDMSKVKWSKAQKANHRVEPACPG